MIGSLCLFLVIALCCSGPDGVLGSDVNWGKKVSCFVVEDTVVCPGCNYRAGLMCPRKLKESQNCLISTSTQPPKTSPPPEITYEDVNSTEEELHGRNLTTLKINEIQKESTKTPIDMAIYLYRILGSKLPSDRYKRELQQEEEKEEAEICNWNGDCPCPLICCKTGPGCPKRCVMGIRLPPPWG